MNDIIDIWGSLILFIFGMIILLNVSGILVLLMVIVILLLMVDYVVLNCDCSVVVGKD